ncbi:FXYD domain-containing ion transport regulator 5-like isoform X1 [Anolis sagrei]|uniref:FXYD domain-containing ion transport regulator 5-like isoform X1 n=2 Tax=Anolis sagrei TaxID=38937 RepID=UPI003521CE61
MPGMPHAWCCEASAMKVFLLLGFMSLTTSLDAEASPASVIEQKEDAAGESTMEPQLFSTPSSYMAEGLADASTELNFLQELETTNANEAITTSETETSTMAIVTTNNMKTPRFAGVTPAEVPPDDQKMKTDFEKIDYNHDFFHYDYHFLRKWGLVAAAILFILGILILTCGKHGKFPRCRGKKRARTYDVAQA